MQIRTDEMHQHSEHGVAAHWRYKEGGSAGAARGFDAKIALAAAGARVEGAGRGDGDLRGVKSSLFDDTIYVLTPQGRVVDLPAGSTPIDFAYHVHTDLGHRCRGAQGRRADGAARLQAAERASASRSSPAKQGGPSRDWLSPQLGYLASPRALAKVRQWFRRSNTRRPSRRAARRSSASSRASARRC